MTGVLLRRGNFGLRHKEEYHVKTGTQTQREGGHINMEAEVREMLPQPRSAWGYQSWKR